jgi:hypothetical protein
MTWSAASETWSQELQVRATCGASSRHRMIFSLNYQETCELNCGVKCGQLRRTLETGTITVNHSELNTALATMVGMVKFSSQMTRSGTSQTWMRQSYPWMVQMEKLEAAQQTSLPLLELKGLALSQTMPA